MSTADPWSDFETLKVNVRHNTVDKLKSIITGFNDECWTMLSKSGKKQDLIDRIIIVLNEWRASTNLEQWNKARGVLYQVRNSGSWRGPTHSTPGLPPTPGAGSYVGSAVVNQPYNSAASTSRAPSYGSFPPSSRNPPLPMTTSSLHTSNSSALPRPSIRFKPSPFFQVDQAVSSIVECPESSSSSDRRQQSLMFSLTPDQVAKLTSADPKYQLRLYCTSSSYFALGTAGLRFGGTPCPIEFPPTCEIRVNQVQITASTKGLKKKPGTAPPADLGKSVRVSIGHQNRVEMVYVNSQTNNNQAPPPPKKYYMVIMLVQVTTVDQLIERAKKGKFRSREDILAKLKQASNDEDDDIVAGPQKTSLKCPLSYCRITTPCRSSQCVHVQCFDALSWYSVNEQTTTWSCPVCEKPINHEDLIVDGYFGSILENTPDIVEDVIVEADGEWHTSDDKYASEVWRQAHKHTQPPPSLTPRPNSRAGSASPSGHAYDHSTHERNPESDDVVVLDSDEDEDEGAVKRELSPSGRERSSTNGLSNTQVIDLTLESDDESTSSRSSGRKRKAEVNSGPSPEQIWKKSRIGDSSNAATVMRNANGNVNSFASNVLASGSNSGTRPYVMNGTSSQPRSHSVQFAPSSHGGSPYVTPYYPPRGTTPPPGSFGSHVSDRPYYSRFGNG
ncbi:PINIT domain-containing protein [Gloeopeniophorella convolvens]|nr:PINIT domain-containing protein [Gloeopeniophorella convolvens]